MKVTGELKNNKVFVEKPKDIGRLFNKSHLGKMLKGEKLQLDLLEAVFLLDETKIKIFCKKKEIDFQKLVRIASKNISHFEIKYLVFKDLRKRGQIIKISKDSKYNFIDYNNHFFVIIFSEKNMINLQKIKKILQETEEKNNELWLAIVDEEGDITYYNVKLLDINGDTKKHLFKKSLGIFLNDRVVIFNRLKSEALFEKEFFGKPFGEGLQLSLIEAFYLLDKNFIDIQSVDEKKISKSKLEEILKKHKPDFHLRFVVFKDLKNRGLIVKTGFKFGAHFRAYTNSPDKTHAEYLVHVVDKDFESLCVEISRAIRLAHSVNKEIIFARVNGKNIDYIKFGRLRP